MKNDIEMLMQKANRKRMYLIWEASKNDHLDELDDEDKLLAQIMKEHEDEFLHDFEFADVLDEYEYTPEYDETNPFLHIMLHSIVENQLENKDPIEAYQFFLAMRNKKVSRHDAIHMIANIIASFLFYLLKEHRPFDEQHYKRILKTLKSRNPQKVWAALDKGIDNF